MTRLWQQTDRELNDGQRLVVNMLKEKAGVTLPGQAADFVAAARRVAGSAPADLQPVLCPARTPAGPSPGGIGVPVPRSFGGSQSGELVLKGSPLGVGLREVEGSPVRVPGLIITAGAAQ